MHNTRFRALLAPILVLLILVCMSVETSANAANIGVPAYQSGSLLSFPRRGSVQSTSAGNNYLADVTAEGGKNIWPSNRMPLKVYIEDGSNTPGYRHSFPQYVRNAFNEWQQISKGRLTWQEVSS